MNQDTLHSRCSVNTNIDQDVFVGIQCDNGSVKVAFPLGFNLSDKDTELRKDILLLLDAIRIHTGKKDSEIQNDESAKYEEVELPIQAYLSIIYDFYIRGYYKEKETQFVSAKRGKIDWNRTIKTQKAHIQDEEVLYLDFTVRNSRIRENELITRVHEYCVYESFRKLGWIFTSYVPPKPSLAFNYRLFKSVVTEKLSNTFDDKNKRLFMDMLAIIECQSDPDAPNNYSYGTYRFEYVWESMIDKVFGEANKELFYPVSHWNTITGNCDNYPLEPDTIMIYGSHIFVLDAKYYKYGMTGAPSHLPESTSINKQITYGEYVERLGYSTDSIYNAFLMPYNSVSNKFHSSEEILHIGEATGNWRTSNKKYERVQGIVIDVRALMRKSYCKNLLEISQLAECIEAAMK